MDDLTWLAARTDMVAVGETITRQDVQHRATLPYHNLVVEPAHFLAVEGSPIVAIGYPTGRHHSLVMAAEARLAVEFGAEEIWLWTDPDLTDMNALLAHIVAVRQAVPAPIVLTVTVASKEAARCGYRAGADHVVVDKPTDARDIVWAETIEAALDGLEGGAQRLATPRDWF